MKSYKKELFTTSITFLYRAKDLFSIMCFYLERYKKTIAFILLGYTVLRRKKEETLSGKKQATNGT